MKLNTKSFLRSLAVTLVLTGSALFFAWNFWQELNRTAEAVGAEAVGTVARVRGRARQRHASQNRWSTLNGSEVVYTRDAIRTDSESGADIDLLYIDADGVEQTDTLTLGPDTFVILDLSQRRRNIEFVAGDISASGENLTVSTQGAVVSLDDGSVNLSRREGEDTSVVLTDGDAVINSGGRETAADTTGILRIQDNGEVTRRQVAVVPKTPRSNSLILTYADQQPVNFSWDLFADWPLDVLEISSTSGFTPGTVQRMTPPVRNENTTAADGEALAREIRTSLTPGTWYWRVAREDGLESGPIGVFTLGAERLPRPLRPARNEIIPFRSSVPAVSFGWESAYFADSHRIEIADNIQFSNPSVSRNIAGAGSLLVENLEEGRWWWRIVPVYRSGTGASPEDAEIRSFTLEKRSGYNPVELLNPPDGSSVSSLDVRDGIGLRWYPQDGLESYYTEIAFDPEFQSIAADSTGSANWTQLMPAPAPGTYYWRVTARASDNSPVPVSEIRSFTVRPLEGTVELIAPPPGGVGEAEPYSPYDFTWRSEVPGRSRFLLKRQDGDEDIRLIETLVEGSRFTAPLPGEGNYIWQIQIVDDQGRILAESAEGKFRISSSFLPPVLSSPEPETAISLVGSDSVVVRWNPALGADAYKAVLKNPDGISLGQTDRVRSLTAEFTLPQNAQPGRYTVELQSIRDNPPAGFPGVSQSASYGFTIEELIRYQASVPASPADGSRIDGLAALRNGVVLQWTQEPLLTGWTVELVSGDVTRLYRTSSPRLALPQLETGRYRWRVLSRDSLGREAPEGPFAGFTVGGIPGPSEPVPVFPAPGQNIDMAARSSLDFEWRPSAQEADFYEVALYAGDSTIPLLRDTTVTGTRYSLTNLGILDVGDFSLTLRARKEYTDLGITRYSPVVRIPFTLSLDIAEAAPTILTEELQYAE